MTSGICRQLTTSRRCVWGLREGGGMSHNSGDDMQRLTLTDFNHNFFLSHLHSIMLFQLIVTYSSRSGLDCSW